VAEACHDAVVFEDERLSYGELDARSSRLAHHLRGLGVGPEVVVGLCIERSLAMLVGLLGILKAGGAYLPLDPDYPPERLAFMLADAGAPVLLTRAALRTHLPARSRSTPPQQCVCHVHVWVHRNTEGLISRIRSTLDVELAIRSLFEAPTVEALVQRLGDARPARAALRAQARPAEIPLSFAQRRLWFLDRLEGASATYSIPLALRVQGILDRPALEAALGDLVERHESLRTIFPDTLGVPRQLILDAEVARPRLAVTAVSEATLAGALSAAARTGFDLARERQGACVLARDAGCAVAGTAPAIRPAAQPRTN
jgi:hypothetical protein